MKRFMPTFALALVVSAPALGQSPACSSFTELVTCRFESEPRLPIRWERSPVVIRWTIVTKPTHFEPGATGSMCKQLTPLREVLEEGGLSQEDFILQATRDLEVWNETGVTFVHTEKEDEADVLLGLQDLDKAYPAAMNLRVERRESEAHAITKAAVCLNPLYSLHNVTRPIAHEFGHTIGLGHVRTNDAVMDWHIEGVTSPNQVEIALIRGLYRLRLARRN